MSQYQENATVTRVEQFSDKNFRVTLHSPQISAAARPGQFAMVRAGMGKDPLLRRPFSIHQTASDGSLQFYFKVVGRGTDILARKRVGEEVPVFGPLGCGFTIKEDGAAIMVGGGLGIAPLLFLVKENCRLKKSCSSDILILGGRGEVEIAPLLDDFKQFGITILTSTDDGSLGMHGNVTDVLQSLDLAPGCNVYACGPEPMMAGVSKFCKAKTFACQVSVESVMACGMGACLGCSRPAKNGTYTHVCLHGPVYDAEKLVWNI